MLRPSLKMPLWAAVALPAAVYAFRGVLRGMDFAPDLPGDAVALGLWLIALILATLTRSASSDDRRDQLPDEMNDKHNGESSQGK
ncbi:MAG: hypothetical protein Q7J82_04415 [Coriobacteriia bacterium]|nr:hypothetical protein [Coriobacteriia bacterium]